jgi:hypothetical protein
MAETAMIAYVENAPGGLLVVFSDGQSAIFPQRYLWNALKEMDSYRSGRSDPTPIALVRK